jgi:hypothetical protein
VKRANKEVENASESLCGGLTDLGCTYEIEFDNRGGNRSRYIYIRRPLAAKIRVSDHPSDRAEKDMKNSRMLVLDVGTGRHGISWQVALEKIADATKKPDRYRRP